MLQPDRLIADNVILIASSAELAQRAQTRARRLLHDELRDIYEEASSAEDEFAVPETAQFWQAMANGDRPNAVAILKRIREALGNPGVMNVLNRKRRE